MKKLCISLVLLIVTSIAYAQLTGFDKVIHQSKNSQSKKDLQSKITFVAVDWSTTKLLLEGDQNYWITIDLQSESVKMDSDFQLLSSYSIKDHNWIHTVNAGDQLMIVENQFEDYATGKPYNHPTVDESPLKEKTYELEIRIGDNSYWLLTEDNKDPNAKVKTMGLTDENIETMCSISSNGGRILYDWGLEPMFEKWIYYEGVNDLENLLQLGNFKDKNDFSVRASRETLAPVIKWLWENKYSYCYCEINSVITGTLDMIALYHEKPDWVYQLYSKEYPFQAEGINKIRTIHAGLKKRGTLLDYVYDVSIEDPTYEVRKNPNYAKDLQKNIEILRKSTYGAKRMSEMTPEETERNSH